MSNLKEYSYYLQAEKTSSTMRRPEKRIVFRDQTNSFVNNSNGGKNRKVDNKSFETSLESSLSASSSTSTMSLSNSDRSVTICEGFESSLSVDSAADSPNSSSSKPDDNSIGGGGKKRRELCPARMEQNKIAARKARLRKKMEFERLQNELDEKSREILHLQEEKQGLLIHINGLYTRLGQMVAGYASAPEASNRNNAETSMTTTNEPPNCVTTSNVYPESDNGLNHNGNNLQQCLFLVNQETIRNPLQPMNTSTPTACYYIPSELMTGMSNNRPMPDTLWIHNGRISDDQKLGTTAKAPLYVPAKRSKQ